MVWLPDDEKNVNLKFTRYHRIHKCDRWTDDGHNATAQDDGHHATAQDALTHSIVRQRAQHYCRFEVVKECRL